MKYATEKARVAFCCDREVNMALGFLELAFKHAGLNIEFVGHLFVQPREYKVVFIYRDGHIVKEQSIEGDSPAQAVKDVAEAVML